MSVKPGSELGEGRVADIRPVVGRNQRDISVWLFAGVAVIGAVLLFGVLDGQRRGAAAPSTAGRTVDVVQTTRGLPPLYVPSEFSVPPPPPPPPPFFGAAPAVPIPLSPQMAPAAAVAPAAPAMPSAPTFVTSSMPLAEPNSSGGDVLVFDGTASAQRGEVASDLAATTAEGATAQIAGDAPSRNGRARSNRLGQLASTVAQGTLIPAVLETALDSTRPGHVRALVSRDVRGFDGSRVLIPRGTRLFGEYRADLSPGQNRAFVRWTRLVRPDGVAIDLDSPAADALGRAGIEGRVNSHLLERFTSALLHSTVSVGMALAGRNAGDAPVIVALPGAAQSLTPSGSAQQIQPTLSVDAGVSVTVFVARDLTFPAVEAGR